MDGIKFELKNQYAICRIENFSKELQTELRNNLTRICHGADQASHDRLIFKYQATLKSFWDRYSGKPEKTKIGMLGELLSHVVILKLIPNFDVISPFFNMEEKSIRKGFDIILYEPAKDSIWITEVKSGGLADGKTPCSATQALLAKARDDLKVRLSEYEQNHWLNAINAAQKSIKGKTDYKDSVLKILGDEGDLAYLKTSTAADNSVLLISTLFGDTSKSIAETTLSNFSNQLTKNSIFKSFLILSIHKETLKKLEDFLKTEAGA